jgi:hypothetical protein
MASDTKKKAKRVATLFGKQKVTTTPEIAAKIKSGEIDPATHNIKNGKFAPKRKAVVGGLGIMPSTGNLKGSASTMNEIKNKSKPGDDSYDLAQGYTNSKDKTKAASANAVAASAVPKTDKATGQMITPAESLALQEQKALKIAPYKADLETLAAQLSTISTEFDEADDDEKIGAAKMKLEKIKASMSATNE